jgi:hypothetical protein
MFEDLRLETVDIFYGHLEYLRTLGIFYDHLYILCSFGSFFPVLGSMRRKNMATLPRIDIKIKFPANDVTSHHVTREKKIETKKSALPLFHQVKAWMPVAFERYYCLETGIDIDIVSVIRFVCAINLKLMPSVEHKHK